MSKPAVVLAIGLGVAVLIGAAVFLFVGKGPVPSLAPSPAPATGVSAPSQPRTTTQGPTFINPKRSAHYESNTPAHGAVLPGVPVNVVLDFNFDLSDKSFIQILDARPDVVGGELVEYGRGETVVDKSKLSMRKVMDSEAPDGIYTVRYNACWPDGSCHDGNFQFAIDRSKAEQLVDLRGRKNVTVETANVAFNPKDVRISQGTKVTWTNNDAVGHYVNTDSHPAHTYYPSQNSKLLKTGESFSMTFDQPGVYPYHCSAHAETMTGLILVD